MGFRRLSRGIAGALFAASTMVITSEASAQWRVGSDSATRLTRLGRAFAYGSLLGVGFAVVDQWQKDPPQWGGSWDGFGKRVASNLGGFYIQEGLTEGLAYSMNRPLDYTPCKCAATGERAVWALQGGYLDEMPDGKRYVAVPRIVGAYVGAFAQSAWRPRGQNDAVTSALITGTTSLGIGALINLYYEFRHKPNKSSTMAGDRR